MKSNVEGTGNRYGFETPPGWEFYDLEKDPYEMDNRYGDPDYAETINSLKEQLRQLRKELNEEDGDYPEIQKIIDEYWDK